MSARRWIAWLAGCGIVLAGSAHAPLAAPETEAWTPDRVRAFVLRVEREMDHLAMEQAEAPKPSMTATCRGSAIDFAIKKSVAMPRVQALVAGKALGCYVPTWLGCSAGAWFVRVLSSDSARPRQPFTRSKVVILEQTPDRVVADVAETWYPNVSSYAAMVRVGAPDEDDYRPFTDAEVDAVKDASRYTITRGKDGQWRITDRKPSFKWICKGALDRE